MEGLREGYEYFASHANVAEVVELYGDYDRWIASVEKEIEAFSEHMAQFEGFKTDANKLAGDVAEFWHADTFNIQRALERSAGPRAEVPRTNGYGSPDVKLGDQSYQLKYYRDADASVMAQSRTFGQDARQGSPSAQALLDSGLAGENDPVYGDMERLIPSDQLQEARQAAMRRAATERARRPEQALRYEKTKDRLTGNVKDADGTSSMDLSRQQANELANEAKSGELDLERWGLTTAQLVEIEEVMRQSLRAGVSAATISAVLEAAPAVIGAIQHLIDEGRLDVGLVRDTGTAAVSGAAKGFLVGTATAAITYSARAGFLGEALNGLDPSLVGSIAAVSVNVITNAVRMAAGRMGAAEFVSTIVRDVFIATCAMLGGYISQSTIKIPVFGYLLGSFVGSAIGGIAWSAAEMATVAVCVDHGFTMFGLVSQDYEVPMEAIEQIGVDVFEPEVFESEVFEPDRFVTDDFAPDQFEPGSIGIKQLRRGVLSVGRVGYATA